MTPRHPAVLFVLFCAAGCRANVAPHPAPACSVVVRRDEARIVFPAVDRTEWTWNRATGARPNYWWSVYLEAPGVHVEVSRGANGPQQTGDLATMLQSATVAVTWPSSGASEFDAYRTIPGLRATVIDARPALVIRDSALFHELFGLNHPPIADCRFSTDDRDEEGASADSVHYVGSGPPAV